MFSYIFVNIFMPSTTVSLDVGNIEKQLKLWLLRRQLVGKLTDIHIFQYLVKFQTEIIQ